MNKRTRLGTGRSTVVQFCLGEKGKTTKVINNSPTELNEQIRFCTWLDKKGIRYYAVPNGGWRHMGEAVKFKRSGVKAGVPDICIPFPVEPYHGLYIELKRVQGSKVTPEQLDWIAYLSKVGYMARVAKGFDEARGIVEYYLSQSPNHAA